MLFNCFLCGIAWLTIVSIHALYKGTDETVKGEIVADGKNLFSTALVYLTGYAICQFVNMYWLKIGICALMYLLGLFPLLSALLLLISRVAPIHQKATGLLNTVTPIIVATNCLIAFIL